MYDAYKLVKIERRGAVLWVTLDDLPLNPMTRPLHSELSHVFDDISRDRETRAVVLTGAGNRAFSAGGDINAMAEEVDNHTLWNTAMPEARQLILSILGCEKPVIARINGHAIGVGASMVLACDITIMVEDSKIGDTHVKVGLVAGDGGALLWPPLVGLAKTRQYLLTGDLITGREAADMGLINFAVPRDQLDAVVDQWATRFGNGPTLAIGMTKRAINMSLRQQGQTFMDASLGLETMSYISDDHREAAFAFRDKREPHFTGR